MTDSCSGTDLDWLKLTLLLLFREWFQFGRRTAEFDIPFRKKTIKLMT